MNACGTYAEYQQHIKRHEKPCLPCSQANTEYVRLWRITQGRTNTLPLRVDDLAHIYAIAPERTQEAIIGALGESVVEAIIQRGTDKARGVCGTRSGYNRHIANSETPCQVCRDDRADYVRANRIRNGEVRDVRIEFTLTRELLHLPGIRERVIEDIGPRTAAAIEAL